MKIELSNEFIERVRAHLKMLGYGQSVEAFIEEAADHCIESYPWFIGDICVHNEECMHWKSLGDWKKEQGGRT